MNLLFSLLTLFLAPKLYAQDPIVLGLGDSATIPISKSGSVRLQNGTVLNVQDLGNRLLVSGKKLGTALIRAGKSTVEVLVVPRPLRERFSELRELLKKTQGLSLGIRDQQIEVTGELEKFEDWVSVSRIFQNSETYRMRAKVKGELQKKAQSYFSEIMTREKLFVTSVDFEAWPHLLLANPKDTTLSRYREAMRPFGIAIQATSDLIEDTPMIRVQILVAEVKKRFAQTLGIKWPDGLSGQLLDSGHIGISRDQLNLKIQTLEQAGSGKILANPTLLCRSGKEAEFLAGGEVPIKISNDRKFGVIWKKYGVLLRIKPLADDKGKMRVELETEVSTIDHSTVVEGTPSFLTNRIQSHFDLSQTRTIALSGLIRNDQSESRDGLPWLSRIPVLGLLFSSQEFREDKTELMMFVTPSIVDEKKEDAKAQMDEFQDV